MGFSFDLDEVVHGLNAHLSKATLKRLLKSILELPGRCLSGSKSVVTTSSRQANSQAEAWQQRKPVLSEATPPV